jgi:hypothetical protein
MRSLPKPLIGLLLGTIAFFAIWMVALKPSSSSGGGSQGGVGQLQSAVNQAHGAVTTSNQANAKLGAPTATTAAPASPAKSVSKAAPVTKAAPATTAKAAVPATNAKDKPATKAHTAPVKSKAAAAPKTAPVSTADQVTAVENAIRDHEVLAVLFYNPAAADDQSMVKELAAVPMQHGQLVRVAVPVSELTQFAAITTKVPVVTSPTLIIIDAKGQATTLNGFAGTGEISQRIDDALAAK